MEVSVNNMSQIDKLHLYLMVTLYVFCPLAKLITELHALKETADQGTPSQQQLMNCCIANQLSVFS